jgi:uncharacterized membrane protein YhaH (DUF805 family)
MNFLEAVKSGFRSYVGFSGRAIRSDYWYWQLFVAILLVPLGIVDQVLNPGTEMGFMSYVNMIAVFALVLPTIAVSVRRLQDIDRAGWWALLLLTGVGAIVLIVWACQAGTQGHNRFGENVAKLKFDASSMKLAPTR